MSHDLGGIANALVAEGKGILAADETVPTLTKRFGAAIDTDLVESNYGEYEGLTPKQIHEKASGWLIFRDGCPGGETSEQVGARADRVMARARAVEGMSLCLRTDTYSGFSQRARSGFQRALESISCSIPGLYPSLATTEKFPLFVFGTDAADHRISRNE